MPRVLIATSDWVNLPGNDSYVMCDPQVKGDGAALGEPVKVKLPRFNDHSDPNVRKGGTVLAFECNGQLVAQSQGAKVGTIHGWVKSIEEIPPGWEVAEDVPAPHPQLVYIRRVS